MTTTDTLSEVFTVGSITYDVIYTVTYKMQMGNDDPRDYEPNETIDIKTVLKTDSEGNMLNVDAEDLEMISSKLEL
jgi:hypothetical protein